MTEHRLHNAIYAAFDEIANAEKVTRQKLAELSRDLLIYVPDTNDIDIVNRLLVVLTPINRRASILYFKSFLPFVAEVEADGETFSRFGKKMSGDKKVKRRMDAIADWLKDENNNIWVWSDANIDMAPKKKDFASLVAKQIQKALVGDEKSDTPPLTREELLAAIFLGGVTIDDMLYGIEAREKALEPAKVGEEVDQKAAA